MHAKKILDSFKQKKYIIGIDIGGTEIKTIIIDRDGEMLFEGKAKTSKKNIINQIVEIIGQLVEQSKISRNKFIGVGIGVPGIIDSKKEKISKSSSINLLNNVKLRDTISKITGFNVLIENDANCMALSECFFGKEKVINNLVYVSIGTGIGGGIVINGKLYTGRGSAAEIGHILVETDGQKCYCGNKGCLEMYVSKKGIEKTAKKLGIQKKSILEIFNLAKAGNKNAIKVFEITGKYLGIGLSSIVKILDPDIILIGGGISNAGDFLLKPTIRQMKKQNLFKPCIVRKASSGSLDGAIGAACLFL